ncbi:MAG: acyl-CoA synthetase (AMP-forming)/AMP-acid ligase II [Paracoccaceae bacterium]
MDNTIGMQDDDFDLKQQPVFVGLPLPPNDLIIRAFDTHAILPLGSEGEITFHSPGMLKSYWGKPEATYASHVGARTQTTHAVRHIRWPVSDNKLQQIGLTRCATTEPALTDT